MYGRFVNLHPAAHQMLSNLHPMGRVAAAEEIALAVIWWYSLSASFMKDQSITLSGGFTAQ